MEMGYKCVYLSVCVPLEHYRISEHANNSQLGLFLVELIGTFCVPLEVQLKLSFEHTTVLGVLDNSI